MAALTAATTRRFRNAGFSWHQNWRVANGDVVYVGSFCGVPGTNALTSRRGYLTTYRNQVNMMWAGIMIRSNYESTADQALNQVTGNTSGTPVPEAWTEAGPIILEQYAVTGLAAQSDLWRLPVYASNDNDFTLTAGYSPAVGRIAYWYSTSSADVLLYGALAAVVI